MSLFFFINRYLVATALSDYIVPGERARRYLLFERQKSTIAGSRGRVEKSCGRRLWCARTARRTIMSGDKRTFSFASAHNRPPVVRAISTGPFTHNTRQDTYWRPAAIRDDAATGEITSARRLPGKNVRK